MTHRQLAKKLRREHSFVWRIEHGERRVDVIEFCWICEALVLAIGNIEYGPDDQVVSYLPRSHIALR